MNIDIEHIAITLRGISPGIGGQLAELLGGALSERLGALDRDGLPGAAIGGLDLGVIDAPDGCDARALSDLIAVRLIDWIGRHGAPPPGPAALPATGEAS
jgi:hypothetical protein